MEAKIENENRGKSYYEMNKQRILESMKEKVVCDRCNKTVVKSHMNRHKKTQYCQLTNYKSTSSNDIQDLKDQLDELKIKLAQIKL